MVENTKIEWATHTFSPWVGCTKISPACDHCYAEGWAKRSGHPELWNGARRRTRPENWKGPVKWNRQAERDGTRPRVFCSSLADVFDNEVPQQWRTDLWTLIASTPHLDWLLLTKRIGNVKDMLPTSPAHYKPWNESWPWANVWIGTTIANQQEADRDIPKLLATPARVRFLSIEPMLGPVDLRGLLHRCPTHDFSGGFCIQDCGDWLWIDWVIAGGESGPKARPSHPDWFGSLRDQCVAAGVSFHFKQWGEWRPPRNYERFTTADGINGKPLAYIVAPDGTVHCFHSECTKGGTPMVRVGKKNAGRTLDGVVHDAFPEVRS